MFFSFNFKSIPLLSFLLYFIWINRPGTWGEKADSKSFVEDVHIGSGSDHFFYEAVRTNMSFFFSSVRSSNSHPYLLVIHHHHPLFQIHNGPQYWTYTFWATTAISKAITGLICWLHVYLMGTTGHHCRIVQDSARECKIMQDGARWCKMMQDGAIWCKMVQDGARWCNMVQDGARLCKMVQDGAR